MKTPFSELFPEMCKLATNIANAEMSARKAKETWILALMGDGWSVTEYGDALLRWLGTEAKVTSPKKTF